MKAAFNTPFEPGLLATTIGSLPHKDVRRGTEVMLKSTPEIPSWVQFPKRSRYENMMLQFTEGLPGLLEKNDKFFFDANSDFFVEQTGDFYSNYLAWTESRAQSALERFAISPAFAAGVSEMIRQLSQDSIKPDFVKGQVTGPFTLGTNLTDQDGKCAYYNEQLRDIIVKIAALKAVWQIRTLSGLGQRAIIFLDEPALLGFGSHLFITISREDVIRDINEVAAAIHAEGALAGVHCEENTDWSLLMDTDLDILDFDAYDHFQAVALYPENMARFFERGGCLAWGLPPTLNPAAAASETAPSLIERFDKGLSVLTNQGFDRAMLIKRSLITPSCGCGGALTEALAERVLDVLKDLSRTLREREGLK